MQKNEIGNQKTTRNSLRTRIIAGLLIIAMLLAAAPPASALYDLRVTNENMGYLWSFTDGFYKNGAWFSYGVGFNPYLLILI